MKLLQVFIFTVFIFTSSIWADVSKSDLYDFAASSAARAPSQVVAQSDTDTPPAPEPVKDEKKEEKEKKELNTNDRLVEDAQKLILDKLTQKYTLLLDDLLNNLSTRLSTRSAEEQKAAFSDLRDRISEKKSLILEKKDIEPLKLRIIVAILDHVKLRLEGMIEQAVRVEATPSTKA